ncbi:peptide transporter PTR2 [Fusarium mexicanum]|uniref:Peptide transporter PTR2 n=1 Tax=Fusarium mexicanum TaxID=751941 RepID=A0A8H5J6G4_9HYPO|nr:peptide transporter PTR2 [Fusarium mexicanum]
MATSEAVQDKSPALDPEANAVSLSDITSDRLPPTTEEKQKLRKIAGHIPWVSYLLCIVELAERASFYGCKTVFNNLLQFPLPKGGNGAGAVAKNDPNGHAGALNRGLQFASAMVLLFNFLAYVIPIFGAWLGDTKTGRFKAIMYGVIIGGVAHVIMVGGAAPAVLKAGNGLAPFMVSFFLLAIGAGLFKPNVVPLIIDQYTDQTEHVKTLKSGERVIVDPETTIQRIMLIFYMCINVGAFFMIATTYIEKYVGFWLAFLLPGIIYILLPVLLMWRYKTLRRAPPQGSDLNNFFKIVGLAIKENKGRVWAKNFFDSVKPSVLAAKGKTVSWDSKAVEHARRTLSACQIFLYQPLFYLNDGGVGTVLSNQGASMTTKGAPNDLLHNFNPLTLMVFAPLMSFVFYPLLNRYHIKFGPITRMTVGYICAVIGSVVGAIIQWRVYKTSPCGYQASTCDGVSPVSIWWQLPTVMLGAIGELFTAVTAYEMAYARAPEGMKSTVVAINLAMQALSSALAQILIPSIKDPNLIWAWAAPGIALFVQTIIFWVRHHHVNDEKFLIHHLTSLLFQFEKMPSDSGCPTYRRGYISSDSSRMLDRSILVINRAVQHDNHDTVADRPRRSCVTSATALAAKLEKGGYSAPSFAQDGLADYPKDPEIIGLRMQLLDATTDLYRLALEPTDSSFMGPFLAFHDASITSILNQFTFWNAVPIGGSAIYAEITAQVNLPESIVRRVLKYAISIRIFANANDKPDSSAYDWSKLGEATVVDIGGPSGHDSSTIAQAFPNLKFFVQDLPQLQTSFDEQVPAEIKSRVKFEPHDFLQPQNTQGDVYMLKMVLHDWPDKYAAKVLRHLVPNLESGSRILLVEAVAPPDTAALPFATLGHMLNAADMHMLQFINSQERNLKDWISLLAKVDERLTLKYVSEVPGSVHQFLEVGIHT